MRPIELLFERAGGIRSPLLRLPSTLAAAHGGDLGIGDAHTYANFVSSLDGVVALRASGETGRLVSGGSEADRFVMGLLRAVADAVVIGAGNFRHAPGALWHAADACPAYAQDFAQLRTQLGLRPHPLLVLVTASGKIDTAQPAVRDAWIATTRAGAERLGGTLPGAARVVVLDPDMVPLGSLLALLRSEGMGRVLTEGGPALLGQLMSAGLVDDLFLTTSPRLFGRNPDDGRKSLIDGVDLGGLALELTSARRHDSHLFLRYVVPKKGA